MEFKFFVGVDVSKDTLDFAVYGKEKLLLERRATNDVAGIKDFLRELKKTFLVQPTEFAFCMEHKLSTSPRSPLLFMIIIVINIVLQS